MRTKSLSYLAELYITKPFYTKELLARITVALRIAPASVITTLTFSDIQLNTASCEVSVANHPVKLTRTEYALLKLLMQHPTQVMVKSLLLERISEDTPDCTESSLKMHMSNLRKNLYDFFTVFFAVFLLFLFIMKTS